MYLFPFTAIVGQEQLRLALVLNAIDPGIGGVLIRGEKGTAKSTMARSLADLLPAIRVVAGCRFGCDPDNVSARCSDHAGVDAQSLATIELPMRVVELPANATEDRLAGTIDLQSVLSRGELRFQPGLLAQANRGILYVDEVNLLPDHLVDLLLDAAAMGRNSVEREGLSVDHPARFMLIGTMNPEEGELRPQLLDRFGLCVDVAGLRTVTERLEVMRRRAAFESDAAAFAARWQEAQAALGARATSARALLPEVSASDEVLRLIAGIAIELEVDGHRADLVMLRTAAALAAWEGRTDVATADVQCAAQLALPHRLHRRPLDAQQSISPERLQEIVDRLHPPDSPLHPLDPATDDSLRPPISQTDMAARPDSSLPVVENPADERTRDEQGAGRPSAEPETNPAPPPVASPPRDPVALALPPIARDHAARTAAGRRQRSAADAQRGRTVRTAVPAGPVAGVALSATVRAAAAHPPPPGSTMAPPVVVRERDVRVKVRESTAGANILFVVDASGSMAARKRMEAAKGAAITLLTDAYQRRDRVALIAFRGQGAELLLPLTNSVELVQRRLVELPTGGRTPLAAGIQVALDLIRQLRLRDARAICIPVLITDGRANVCNVAGGTGSPIDEALALAEQLQQPDVYPLVLDTDTDQLSLGLAGVLAQRAGAQYTKLADLTAAGIAASVRDLS